MNTRLKCVLLDDELPGLSYLKMLCEQLPELEVVKAFNSPELFMQEAHLLDFDLCILDIEMPEISGLQVAQSIGGKSVIFTTAYKEYAAEAFDLDAVDYVRKPVQKERLQQAVRKALLKSAKRATRPSRNYIQVNTDRGKTLLYIDQIAYVRISDIDSRDKIVRLHNGDDWLMKNISYNKLTAQLPAATFCRINKQELLCLECVLAFSFDEITTTLRNINNRHIKLTLSESYRNEFLQKIKI